MTWKQYGPYITYSNNHRGNDLKLQKNRARYDLRNFFNNIIYTPLCTIQQIYYIHNVVQMQLISYIHNTFH